MSRRICFLLSAVALGTVARGQSFDELLDQAEKKLRAEDASAALQLVDAALRLDGERWDGHYLRAVALLSLRRFSEAESSAEAALSRAPAAGKDSVQKLLERVRAGNGSGKVPELLREAEAAQKEGLNALAARKYAEAYALDSTQGAAGLKAAALYLLLEEYAAAGKLLASLKGASDAALREEASRLQEQLRSVVAEPMRQRLSEARDALDQSDLTKAGEALGRAAELLAEDAELSFLRAKLAVRMKRLDEALQHLRAANTQRAIPIERLRGDFDLALLARHEPAARWLEDAFGKRAVESLQQRAAGPQVGEAIQTGIGLAMRYVKPDPEFVMGSPSNEPGRDSDEDQRRAPITRGFWLGETEVTQAQWRAVMGTTPWQGQSYVQEGAGVAATHVSWEDAQEFCRRLTQSERTAGRLPTGHAYRLPREAEWELACRAGMKTAYSFGNDPGKLGEYAVFRDSRRGAFAHEVKLRKPNDWGFYDMHGNVWEWCEDIYSGSMRVGRGGSWGSSAENCRSAYRVRSEPGPRNFILGFRPALAASSDK
jgi:thioredoxin-like negative regulator of GroEL